MTPEAGARWMGTNGGVGNTIFVDGFMAGLWRLRDGRVVTDVFRRLTKQETADLEAEVGRDASRRLNRRVPDIPDE